MNRLSAAGLIALTLSACNSTPNPPVDAGVNDAGFEERDASPNDAGGTDTGPSDTGSAQDSGSDAGPSDSGSRDASPIDAGPGNENLIGTSLEGIQIEWNDTLELCAQWRENRSLTQELDQKVHVTLPPHFRPSLGDGHLAAARLEHGRVRTSPWGADRHSLQGSTATLTKYELSDPAGDSYLNATIEHSLGAIGTLRENYSVYRSRGNKDPVRPDASSFFIGELAFSFEHPNGEFAMLEPCAGPSDYETHIEALTAVNGSRAIAVHRVTKSLETFAGSYPVILKRSIMSFSDRPWENFAVGGYWSQTYAAEHHNWFEESIMDFTKSVNWYHSRHRPYLEGQTPPSANMPLFAHFYELASWGANPHIDVRWLDFASGRETDETWTLEPDGAQWSRLDRHSLEPVVRSMCANGDVRAVSDPAFTGGAAHAFQLLRCPRAAAPGFDVVRVYVAAFQEDFAQIGASIEALREVTVQGRAGFEFDVGTHEVEITVDASDRYWMTVRDQGGQTVASSIVIDGDLADVFSGEPRNTVVATAPGVSMRMVREYVGQGAGTSTIYAPVSFELTFAGQTHLVDAFDRLRYSSTHHNWQDTLEADTGELILHWKTEFVTDVVFKVRAVRKSDGVEVLPETQVTVQ